MDAPPVIDIAPLLDGTPGTGHRHAVVGAVHEACLRTGFFVAVGHGLDPLVGRAFGVACEMFALPQSVKESLAMVDRRGYVPSFHGRLDPSLHGSPMEYYDLALDGHNPWPPVPDFESVVREYQTGALGVAAAILRALAEALQLESDFFADRMANPQCFVRMMHYEPDAVAPGDDPTVLTAPHTDYGAITLLATDGVGGLEVRPRGGDWVPVHAPAGSLVVNLGDMLARWTNLVYASTPHRVVAPTGAERYSIPFFVNPDPDTIVECLPSCVTPERPCRFEAVTAADFLARRIADGGFMDGDP